MCRPSDVRLYAVPVKDHGRRLGAVVVALSVEPYEQTRKVALVSSLVFGLVVLVLGGLAARWLVGASLRQVTRMTRQAAAWSERDLDHRFGLGEAHDEITELAASLDALLDRLARKPPARATVLRRALARAAHAARACHRRDGARATPRAGARGVPARARESPKQRRAAHADHRRTRCRRAPRSGLAPRTADAYVVAAEAADACSGLTSERGLELVIEHPPRPIRIGVDPDIAERILQPVLENACRYGTSTVNIAIGHSGSAVQYAVADDGPGVVDEERERIFEPGVRELPRTATMGRVSACPWPAGSRTALRARSRRSRTRTAAVSSFAFPRVDRGRDTAPVPDAPNLRLLDLLSNLADDLCEQLAADGCVISRVIGDVLIMVADRAPEGVTLQQGQGYLVPDFRRRSRCSPRDVPAR